MKMIHCADLHLDSKMSANLSKEQAKERKNEILRTFVHIVEYAAANEVRAILIAGDLFDIRNVSAMARNYVREMIVGHPEIDFLYLKGNHDNDNFLSKLDEIPENLKLFEDTWTSYSYEDGKIAVSGLELSEKNQPYVYNSLVLDPNVYNIVTLHGQAGEYRGKNNAQSISLANLRNKNIDYLALGHVHSYVCDKLDARGIYCYPGCPEGRGFDECGTKGFVVLDIDGDARSATTSFITCANRTLYTIPVDVTGVTSTNEAAKRIEEEINRQPYPTNSLVKIELTGGLNVECELNIDYLQELFAGYFYFVKLEDSTGLLINYSDYEKDESLKGEFVRMVMNSDMDEEKKCEVIRCGIMALSGEEL